MRHYKDGDRGEVDNTSGCDPDNTGSIPVDLPILPLSQGGKAADFDSVIPGSNPGEAAKQVHNTGSQSVSLLLSGFGSGGTQHKL